MQNNETMINEIENIYNILELAKTDKKKLLHVDKCKKNEPTFVLDDDEKLHTLIPLETLDALVNALKDSQEENFNLKLEKVILRHVPVDFADALAVVMSELSFLPQEQMDLDLNTLVKNVKKKHPNLFVNIDGLLPSNVGEIRHIR